ncbi:MAG: ABC transporter permease, partial [Phormidesmis sp.]
MTALLRPIKASAKALTCMLWRKTAKIKPLVPLNESQWAHISLLKTLVQRDMDARYKGSVLGNLWPLLNQLSQLLIYTYVFAVVLQVKLSLKGVAAENP